MSVSDSETGKWQCVKHNQHHKSCRTPCSDQEYLDTLAVSLNETQATLDNAPSNQVINPASPRESGSTSECTSESISSLSNQSKPWSIQNLLSDPQELSKWFSNEEEEEAFLKRMNERSEDRKKEKLHMKSFDDKLTSNNQDTSTKLKEDEGAKVSSENANNNSGDDKDRIYNSFTKSRESKATNVVEIDPHMSKCESPKSEAKISWADLEDSTDEKQLSSHNCQTTMKRSPSDESEDYNSLPQGQTQNIWMHTERFIETEEQNKLPATPSKLNVYKRRFAQEIEGSNPFIKRHKYHTEGTQSASNDNEPSKNSPTDIQPAWNQAKGKGKGLRRNPGMKYPAMAYNTTWTKGRGKGNNQYYPIELAPDLKQKVGQPSMVPKKSMITLREVRSMTIKELLNSALVKNASIPQKTAIVSQLPNTNEDTTIQVTVVGSTLLKMTHTLIN